MNFLGAKVLTKLVLITQFLWLALLANSSHAQEMTLVYAQGYIPYSWKGNNGKVQGLEIDFVNEIVGKRMGIKVKHEIYPWARSQSMVKAGSADAFVTIPNDVRRQYTQVSHIPFFETKFLLYTGMSNPKKYALMKIKSLAELIKRNDLMHGQIVGGGWHAIHLKGAKQVHEVLNSIQILKMLDRNRVDVYIEQAPLISYEIKQIGFQDKILEINNVMDNVSWNLCIGKDSPYVKILPELNKLMASMKKDGSLAKLREQIFRKYR